jgi:hypothetical protein
MKKKELISCIKEWTNEFNRHVRMPVPGCRKLEDNPLVTPLILDKITKDYLTPAYEWLKEIRESEWSRYYDLYSNKTPEAWEYSESLFAISRRLPEVTLLRQKRHALRLRITKCKQKDLPALFRPGFLDLFKKEQELRNDIKRSQKEAPVDEN